MRIIKTQKRATPYMGIIEHSITHHLTKGWNGTGLRVRAEWKEGATTATIRLLKGDGTLKMTSKNFIRAFIMTEVPVGQAEAAALAMAAEADDANLPEPVMANGRPRAVVVEAPEDELARLRAAALAAFADHERDMATDPTYRAEVKKIEARNERRARRSI
ncbi:MAG: hypothetical protein E6R08_06245 [Nevskiaceae bacterium]|nr:MAG: hypothetical protein E6R08_06245 [Nevskiaceae bacterium]